MFEAKPESLILTKFYSVEKFFNSDANCFNNSAVRIVPFLWWMILRSAREKAVFYGMANKSCLKWEASHVS